MYQNDKFVINYMHRETEFPSKMGQLRNEKLLKAIAITFKDIRLKKGLTQEDVFNDTSLHIGRIETAKTNLSISAIEELCKYYEISLNDFFDLLKY